MAEKKKLTTAEILAAARKAASGQPEGAPAEPAKAEPPAESATPPAAAKPPAKPAAPGSRPSVADILAAARAAKGGASEEKPAAKPAAEKPTAKAAPKAAAKEQAAPAEAAAAEKDTSSILAAARKSLKPGPISKAEAEAKGQPVVDTAKRKAEVPPMPVKPDYARPKAAAEADSRRGFFATLFGSFLALGMTSLTATAGLWTLGTARFMFPNILTEPPSRFKVGFPADFPPGAVETKYVAQFGVWVVNTEYMGQAQIVALKTVCTHLGCTPNWLEGEQKYKCPCHGSGFYKDGINFEGPAPRPLERYAIRKADDGQLEVDKSKTFQEEMGQWADSASFFAV